MLYLAFVFRNGLFKAAVDILMHDLGLFDCAWEACYQGGQFLFSLSPRKGIVLLGVQKSFFDTAPPFVNSRMVMNLSQFGWLPRRLAWIEREARTWNEAVQHSIARYMRSVYHWTRSAWITSRKVVANCLDWSGLRQNVARVYERVASLQDITFCRAS